VIKDIRTKDIKPSAMHSAINHKHVEDVVRGGKYGMRKSLSNSSTASKRNGVGTNLQSKSVRDTDMVIIRNKYTKEVVDLEVR
jgi:hypothetical protein